MYILDRTIVPFIFYNNLLASGPNVIGKHNWLSE